MNYFDDAALAYLSIHGDTFALDEQTFTSLRVMLVGLVPIRKRFAGGELACYAPDAQRSNSGIYCAFCPHRRECQRKLRLQLLYLDAGEPRPVFFELNRSSFGTLRALVTTRGLEQLQTEILSMRLIYDELGHRRIEFSLA